MEVLQLDDWSPALLEVRQQQVLGVLKEIWDLSSRACLRRGTLDTRTSLVGTPVTASSVAVATQVVHVERAAVPVAVEGVLVLGDDLPGHVSDRALGLA